VKYPDLPSAMRLVPHSEELPVPKPPENLTFSDDNCDSDEVHGHQKGDNADRDPTLEASCSSFEPKHGDLKDLFRDLNLSKKQAELLGYRPRGWNLLHQDTDICFFRNGQIEFKEFFCQESDLVFFKGICSVTEALGHQHDPTEWHLFIDSSKVSLKAVLIYNGNKFPCVALAHAANMKQSYGNTFGKDPVWKIKFEHLWVFKGHCSFDWLAAWLHTVLLLSV
jgi:hypothetical protein